MHVRLNTIRGADDIDGGVRYLREALPDLRHQRGYRGLSLSAERSAGTVAILSRWETEADREASESTASKMRRQATMHLGGEVTVELMEEVLAVFGDRPPREGCVVRIRRVRMDPARIDDHVAWFTDEMVPALRAAPGFRAVRNMVDRSGGSGVVGLVWADRDALADGDAGFEERRRRPAEDRGLQFGESRVAELLISELT